jgi:hypothetical protein
MKLHDFDVYKGIISKVVGNRDISKIECEGDWVTICLTDGTFTKVNRTSAEDFNRGRSYMYDWDI